MDTINNTISVDEKRRAFNEMLQEQNPKFNGAFSLLKEGDGHLVGNEQQLTELDNTLNYPETPNAILLAEQGSGKTATVEHWLRLNRDNLFVVVLNIETLGELGNNTVVARIRDMFNTIKHIRDEYNRLNPNNQMRVALFVDEFHKLYAYGLNGTISAGFNAFKDNLARGTFPIITATTDYEYAKTINTDPALVRRLHPITFPKIDHNLAKIIIRKRLDSWNEKRNENITMSDENIEQLLEFAQAYIIDQVEPARSISILESALVTAVADNRTEITLADVKQALSNTGVNVDVGTNAQTAKRILNEQVLGQPLATDTVTTAINRLKWIPRDYKKPLMTLLFIGTTGTGKTQTAKALTTAYFGTVDALVTINGGNYVTPDSIPELHDFIYNAFTGSRQRTLLFDEIEKMGRPVIMSLMRVIDEGIVTNSRGQSRAINSAIVIATSNLGAEQFGDFKDKLGVKDIGNADKIRQEWRKVENVVREALQAGDRGMDNGLRPEFIERFQAVVPFIPFSNQTFADIADKQLMDLRNSLRANNVVLRFSSRVDWTSLTYTSTDPGAYFVEHKLDPDPKGMGARSVARWIDEIKGQIANILENSNSGTRDGKKIVLLKSNDGVSYGKRPNQITPELEVIDVTDERTE